MLWGGPRLRRNASCSPHTLVSFPLPACISPALAAVDSFQAAAAAAAPLCCRADLSFPPACFACRGSAGHPRAHPPDRGQGHPQAALAQPSGPAGHLLSSRQLGCAAPVRTADLAAAAARSLAARAASHSLLFPGIFYRQLRRMKRRGGAALAAQFAAAAPPRHCYPSKLPRSQPPPAQQRAAPNSEMRSPAAAGRLGRASSHPHFFSPPPSSRISQLSPLSAR